MADGSMCWSDSYPLKKHGPWVTPVEPTMASMTSVLFSLLCLLSSLSSLVIDVQAVAKETVSDDSDSG